MAKQALKSGRPSAVGICPASDTPVAQREGVLRCPATGCTASWYAGMPAIPRHWLQPYEPKHPRYREYMDGNHKQRIR